MDSTLCTKCKDSLATNLAYANMKRIKTEEEKNAGVGQILPKQTLNRVLFAFLGIVGMIGVAYSPMYAENYGQNLLQKPFPTLEINNNSNFNQQIYNPDSYDQNYKVF